MWGVVLLFHSYRYSSPKTWSTNGSRLLVSPVFSCELLWVLWNRIWVCISLISVASVVSIFFCWPTHYIFTWILTTVWLYLPQVCKCSCLVFHCRHLSVLGFQVSCFSCDFQLMINCRKLMRVQIVPVCWLVWWRMQAMFC